MALDPTKLLLVRATDLFGALGEVAGFEVPESWPAYLLHSAVADYSTDATVADRQLNFLISRQGSRGLIKGSFPAPAVQTASQSNVYVWNRGGGSARSVADVDVDGGGAIADLQMQIPVGDLLIEGRDRLLFTAGNGKSGDSFNLLLSAFWLQPVALAAP